MTLAFLMRKEWGGSPWDIFVLLTPTTTTLTTPTSQYNISISNTTSIIPVRCPEAKKQPRDEVVCTHLPWVTADCWASAGALAQCCQLPSKGRRYWLIQKSLKGWACRTSDAPRACSSAVFLTSQATSLTAELQARSRNSTSLALSLSLSVWSGEREQRKYHVFFFPHELGASDHKKVAKFVASRFCLIFSLGGSRK